MNIKTNYYGDIRITFLFFVITLTSAFTCAWRNLTIHVGKYCVLWTQLSFWSEPSYSLRERLAGIRWRVDIFDCMVFHFTVLPLIPFLRHYRKPWNKPACWYNQFIWWLAKTFVDRRYSPKWDVFKKRDANRWAGVTGNALLEFKSRRIPAVRVPNQLTAKLTSAVPTTRSFIDFQLCGIPIATDWFLSWVKRGEPYPYCDISLWINNLSDIKEGAQLSSFGGELWPSAWPEYFRSHKPTAQCPSMVTLTAKGADLLLAEVI